MRSESVWPRGGTRERASPGYHRGLAVSPAGVALGLIASLLLGRAVEAQLWPGVKPYDPVTLASTVFLLLATGVLACWIPARRATRVDPMVALRYE